MRVVSPPNSEPNESGISSVAGERPAFSAKLIATGIRIASAPTLFINPESTVTSATNTKTCRLGRCRIGSRCRIRRCKIPEARIAALKIKTSATVTTAGLLNPVKASSGVTRPRMRDATSASTATTSWRQRPQMKSASVTASRAMSEIWGMVMEGPRKRH